MDTIKDYWHRSIKPYWRIWLWRDGVTRIITINFIVWLVVSVACFIDNKPGFWLSILALPSNMSALPARAWTLLTYMFTQFDFLHLLTNMLWLLLFGRLFEQTQGTRRLVILYLYAGVAAGLVFLLVNTTHVALLGASCAVLAIVGATTVLMPDLNVNLLIFGRVRLLWVAVAACIFFVVLSTSLTQSIAHAVGLAVGVVYAWLKSGDIDITAPVAYLYGRIVSSRPQKARPTISPYGPMTTAEMQEFDDLLAKVGRSGYQSLSTAERQRLFILSQKVRK